jgi:hypothetical protein
MCEALPAKISDFYYWNQWKCRENLLPYDYSSDFAKGTSGAENLYFSQKL